MERPRIVQGRGCLRGRGRHGAGHVECGWVCACGSHLEDDVLREQEEGLEGGHGIQYRQVGQMAVGDHGPRRTSGGHRVKAPLDLVEPLARVNAQVGHFLEIAPQPFHDRLAADLALVQGVVAAAATDGAPVVEVGAGAGLVVVG